MPDFAVVLNVNGEVEVVLWTRELLRIAQMSTRLPFDSSKLEAQLQGKKPIIGHVTHDMVIERIGRHRLGIRSGESVRLERGDVMLPKLLLAALTKQLDETVGLRLRLSLKARQLV